MITSTRQARRRLGVVLASLLLVSLSVITLIQDESASDMLYEIDATAREVKAETKLIQFPKVHLVVVACEGKSKSAVDEAHNMIKSAVLLSIDPKIKVTIFTNEGNEDHIRSLFLSWPTNAQDRIQLSVRTVHYPLPPEEVSEFRDWWGPCASFRLFLPEVLSDVDSVIYVDSDVLFLQPPQDLWDNFKNFDPRQVGALAPRVGWDFKVPGTNPNFILRTGTGMTQVNSGVFLMNLTRMREPVFNTAESISLNSFKWDKDLLLPLYYRNKKDMFGDQNLINTAFHYNPELIYFLPCRWNYHHKFCFDAQSERSCPEADEMGAAIAHGNAKTFYNNYSPVFKAINDGFTKYNWQNDLVEHLYKEIERRVKDPTVEHHEHCGGHSETFLKTLKAFAENYKTLDRII